MEDEEQPELLVITWVELFRDVARLASLVERVGFDIIVAVARGGLIPARILSDFTGVKRILSLGLEYYRGLNKRGSKPRIVSDLGADVSDLKVLIVDDVADTGETLKVAKEHVKQAGARTVITAVVYLKPWCTVKPDYHSRIVNKWIVFPYEHVETAVELLRKGFTREELKKMGFSDLALVQAEKLM